MKLTKKQIEIIRKNTPNELKNKQISICQTLGYYQPAGANWSFVAGYINYNNTNILVVTQFGAII